MDVGTLDIIEDVPEAEGKPSGRRGGGNSPGGGGGGGGGGQGPDGGSDNMKPNRKEPEATSDPQEFRPGVSRILTAFLLLVVLMTFGGLIAAYVVIATNNVAEWNPFTLPIQVWLSTAIIVASSITYHFGQSAVSNKNDSGARRWMVITTVLGAAFISSQLLAWIALSARGLYLQGNPYAGFFFIITAVHAVHVLGGITALGAILLRIWYPTARAEEILRRKTLSQVVGWYWHFMGALWVVLFLLLGFWK